MTWPRFLTLPRGRKVIPPRNGEGDRRPQGGGGGAGSIKRDVARGLPVLAGGLCPSTSLRLVPLPLQGRNVFSPTRARAFDKLRPSGTFRVAPKTRSG